MFKNQNPNNHGFPYLATLETSETTSEVLERSEALEAVCPMKNITHWVPIYPCLQHGELGTDFQFPLVFRCALETLAKKSLLLLFADLEKRPNWNNWQLNSSSLRSTAQAGRSEKGNRILFLSALDVTTNLRYLRLCFDIEIQKKNVVISGKLQPIINPLKLTKILISLFNMQN